MTFLAPGFLLAAAVAAGLAVALHFLVTRQPPSAPLPTARFIPAAATTVVAAARRPHDLLLLLLRVGLLGLVGAAFARPRLAVRREPVMRLVVADRSRDVADLAAVRDSARRLLRAADALILFDSAARVVGPEAAGDTAVSFGRSGARGVISTALIAALREAARRRDGADSLELDLISPLAAEEVDGATLPIRALWHGRIHVARVPAAPAVAASPVISLRASADDPLRVLSPLQGAGPAADDGAAAATGPAVRVVRDGATAADSAWARGGPTRGLVIWPATGVAPSWPARTPIDTAGAVVVLRPIPTAVVASFPRVAGLDTTRGARTVARWADGEPAAVERPLGAGCARDVAIPVPAAGDFVLRPEVTRLVAALLASCDGGAGAGALAAGDEVAALAGEGPLVAGRRIAAAEAATEPMVPWLLGAALVLMAAEVRVRRAAAARSGGAT